MKDWLKKIQIAVAVGKVVYTGKGSKVLEKIDKSSQAAGKALEALDLVKELIKK